PMVPRSSCRRLVRPFGATSQMFRSFAALALSPVVWKVTAGPSGATTAPLNFLPTVSETSRRPNLPVAPGALSGITALTVLETTAFLLFVLFFFASATLPDARPTVTLVASARTPTSASRLRLLFISGLPPQIIRAPEAAPIDPGPVRKPAPRTAWFRPSNPFLGFKSRPGADRITLHGEGAGTNSRASLARRSRGARGAAGARRRFPCGREEEKEEEGRAGRHDDRRRAALFGQLGLGHRELHRQEPFVGRRVR